MQRLVVRHVVPTVGHAHVGVGVVRKPRRTRAVDVGSLQTYAAVSEEAEAEVAGGAHPLVYARSAALKNLRALNAGAGVHFEEIAVRTVGEGQGKKVE